MRILLEADHDTRLATDPADALQLLQIDEPDLVRSTTVRGSTGWSCAAKSAGAATCRSWC
jgi:hypothetical protein